MKSYVSELGKRISHFWLFLIFCLCWPAYLGAAGPGEPLFADLNALDPGQREKKLVEGAKKEGVVVVYTSENINLLKKFETGFAKRYPFVRINFWRAGGDRVGSRTMTEFRAGKLEADLIGLAFDVANEIKKIGALGRYYSPERKFYADIHKDAEGYYTPTNVIHAVIGYNSDLVKPADAPRDYADLLKPYWKGNLTIDTEPSRAVMGWLKAWGEEATRKYFQGLARNDVVPNRGHTLQAQLLCAGQYKAAVELYLYRAAQMKRAGCPMGIAYPNPTTVASAQSWAISAKAPHPHAAALLLDFLLSAEAGDIVAQQGRVPARTGVKAMYPELTHLQSGNVTIHSISADDAERLREATDELVKEFLFRQ